MFILKFNKKYIVLLLILISIFTCLVAHTHTSLAQSSIEMPFYDLKPRNLVLRSEFYTSFTSSTNERKHNVETASRTLNKIFVDVGGEFSFNHTIGPRTEAKGYKTSKIIVNGQFVDGVGGGVCQVSTTLYNAVLLAGLKITEYHPHSLPVSYVSPSFDAMVSYGGADLRFINNTHNPIIIYSTTQDGIIRIQIYGEPMSERYLRKSIITDEIPAPKEEEYFDVNCEYPEIFKGEHKTIRYSRPGIKSEGYLIMIKNGREVKSTKIRNDVYNATKGLIVYGNTNPPEENINNSPTFPERVDKNPSLL